MNFDEVLLCIGTSFNKLLELKEFTSNCIDINKQMEEASFLFRRILLATSNCHAQDFTSDQNKKMIQGLSLLWSYVCSAVDFTLNKQHE